MRAVEGFFHGRNGRGVFCDSHHSEAYAIVRDALVDLQFAYEGALQGEIDVALLFAHCHEGGHFFYDTAKHMT